MTNIKEYIFINIDRNYLGVIFYKKKNLIYL